MKESKIDWGLVGEDMKHPIIIDNEINGVGFLDELAIPCLLGCSDMNSIWLGVYYDQIIPMSLSREQVGYLVTHLQTWLVTGTFNIQIGK